MKQKTGDIIDNVFEMHEGMPLFVSRIVMFIIRIQRRKKNMDTEDVKTLYQETLHYLENSGKYERISKGNRYGIKNPSSASPLFRYTGIPFKFWDFNEAKEIINEIPSPCKIITAEEGVKRELENLEPNVHSTFRESAMRSMANGFNFNEQCVFQGFKRELGKLKRDKNSPVEGGKGDGEFYLKEAISAWVKARAWNSDRELIRNNQTEQPARKKSTKRGKVYIFTNPSMPGLLKIGEAGNVIERVQGLSSHSGVPENFEIIFSIEVEDCVGFENKVHEALKEYRINKRREFFKLDAEEAIKTICELYLEEQNSS